MPLWWAAVHSASMGLTNGAIAAIPCQTDYQYITTSLDTTAIKGPELREEVGRFQYACYGGARAKLMWENGKIDEELAKNTDWIGSKYFLTTPGYYDHFQAEKPVKGFTYVSSRDDGHGTGQAQGGYPSCKDWWTASKIGLHDRLEKQLPPGFWHQYDQTFAGNDAHTYAIRGLTVANRVASGGLKNILGQGVAGNATSMTGSAGGDAVYKTWGGLTAALGGFDLLAKAPAYSVMAAKALPFMQFLILMVIVIAMPFILVFSGYGFKAVGLISFAYFGVVTLTFWVQLSRWLQNNLTDMVYGNTAAQWSASVHGVAATFDQSMLTAIQGFMLIVFPPLWLGMLGWAGYNVGSAISTQMTGQTRKAGEEGEKSAGQVKSAATGAATRKLKK